MPLDFLGGNTYSARPIFPMMFPAYTEAGQCPTQMLCSFQFAESI